MKRIYTTLLILIAVELILAFICGPHSCEWGGQVYFYFGMISLIIPVSLLILQKGIPLPKRLAYIMGISLLLITTWIIGFIAGDFKIICRLF